MKRSICFLFFCNILYGNIIQELEKKVTEYKECGMYQEAVALYEELFRKGERSFYNYFEYAVCCTMIGKTEHAKKVYAILLKQDPNLVSVLYNMGYTLKMEGNLEEAIPFYKKTIELVPNKEDAHFGLGMAYLVHGNFKDGFSVHRRYLKRTGRNADTLRKLLQQNDVAGKIILLTHEGGFGDVIHFVRYAKALKNLGAYTVVAVKKELLPLLSGCSYIDKLVYTGSTLPNNIVDHTTLMSMPAIWYDQFNTLVDEVPYLSADPQRITYWQQQLSDDPNFKIGICWGASIHNDSSRPPVARRSIPLNLLYKLASLPNVSLYSLQRGDGEEQLLNCPKHITIKTFDDNFDRSHGAFVDTAAVMTQLDLVISVDSAIAHLAGALGRPVFLMLPYSTDWRWIARRIDSPWYPTMRIFKQPKAFDWETVVQQIYDTLAKNNRS